MKEQCMAVHTTQGQCITWKETNSSVLSEAIPGNFYDSLTKLSGLVLLKNW